MNSEYLSLRKLKAARVVADLGNISHAAEVLNRTQSAVSKGISELESRLNVQLFDRSAQGVEITNQGAVFIERIRQAEAEFSRAEVLHAQVSRQAATRQNNPVFNMEISRKRLAAFLVVYDLLDVAAAAERLRLTRAAVYSSLRQLEQWLGCPLFSSGAVGLTSTPAADGLATHTRLAFALIRHGLEDISSLQGEMR
ncbi:MAG TPA: LysR family transcriptional regulator, partial [Xanthomonadales bacterium]|nr:LysR family transcriptional regulator [Xanthomonadales bacterium]